MQSFKHERLDPRYGTAVLYAVYTVIETPIYTKKVGGVISDDERDAIAAFIARNPTAGDVIRGAGGIRKLRWPGHGRGKRGGARVIYYNRLDRGEIWLLTIFTKSKLGTIPAHELNAIKKAIERGQK